MSKKKAVLAVAVVLAGAGAIAAISAPGPRGHGRHSWNDDGHGGMERRGWLARELTKEQFDTRVRERFAAIDRNSDGVIEAAELEAMINQRSDGMRQRLRERFGRDGGNQGGPTGPGNPMIQRFDTNRDGKVTRDEFQAEIRKQFAAADLDNDGRISDADLPPMQRGNNAIARMAAMPQVGGRGWQGRRDGGGERFRGREGGFEGGRFGGGAAGGGIGLLIAGADVKDGAVTLDAVLAAKLKTFDRFDRNADAVIDRADGDAVRKEMTDYQVKRFIHAHGADKDGKVTRDQFFARSTERFAQMDRNNDGRVDRGDRSGPGGDGRMRGPRGEGRGPGGPGPGGEPPKQ